MRFNQIYFDHTEEFEDVKEIKFIPNSMDYATVEIWIQDNSYDVVLINNETNEVESATEQEREFTLEFAKENSFI